MTWMLRFVGSLPDWLNRESNPYTQTLVLQIDEHQLASTQYQRVLYVFIVLDSDVATSKSLIGCIGY